MTLRTLIFRSLRFHARSHIGVVLGAAIGSAVLVGALVVGDSVRASLRARVEQRLAGTCVAMNSGDRLFAEDLSKRMHAANTNQLTSAGGSPPKDNTFSPTSNGELGTVMLALPASIDRQDGSARANRISLYGIDSGSWANVCHVSDRPDFVGDEDIWLNEELARQLNVGVGDEVVLRVKKPSAVGLDAAISPRSDESVAIRSKVGGILPAYPGNLSLVAGGSTPMNAFVPRTLLENSIGITDRGNLLLLPESYRWRNMTVGDYYRIDKQLWRVGQRKHPLLSLDWLRSSGGHIGEPIRGNETVALASKLLSQVWDLDDTQCRLTTPTDSSGMVELRTSRVFLDSPTVRAALDADESARPVLTYLANLIIADTNATPYSMITGAGAPYTPEGMADDEIVVNQWLADDLQLDVGSAVDLVYFEPESGAQLLEATNRFRVRDVVPLEKPWLDRTLMPDFPGVAEAASTHDWDGGFPLVYTIREKDEDYWKRHKGTPKAFVTLAAGQKMWGNRFGEVTAVRFPVAAGEVPNRTNATNAEAGARGVTRPAGVEEYRAELEEKILANLRPEELGFRFEPVREQALKSVDQAQDFGELFLGFSFFLILAAMLLMALMFAFGLEQRAAETGTLLAVGFPPRKVRGMLLREGAVLVTIGGVLGVAAGLGFAKSMIYGLTTVWSDAVGKSELSYHATAGSVLIGVLSSIVVGAITLWITLRKQARQPVRELLAEGGEARGRRLSPGCTGRCWSHWVGAVSLAFALILIGWTISRGDTANAEAFFSAGSLLLISGLSFCSGMFAKMARSIGSTGLTLRQMGVRGSARRRSRSLAVITLLACGSFLIVAIGAFRMDASRDAIEPDSGTGGFALIGEATLPVLQDLNSRSGREYYNLNPDLMKDVKVVPLRVREGDEASCLNLTRAQQPRLLGVKPELLEGRFTFAKIAEGLERGQGWKVLAAESENRNPTSGRELVPAVGDANSIQWAMGKKVGQTIDYTDGRGDAFKVRLAGAVANSILQGSLIISESDFVDRFPNESGYRMFLIDAPADRAEEVSAELSRALRDQGLQVTLAVERLNAFNAVQNTYLGTFQVLGGLGLLLGSAGLGVVVLRNVLERRGELALLLAVGFRRRALRKLVMSEHGVLLGLGMAVGVIAAAIAILPPLLSPGSHVSYGTLTLTLAAVLVNGAVWTWLATRVALRGRLLDALRSE